MVIELIIIALLGYGLKIWYESRKPKHDDEKTVDEKPIILGEQKKAQKQFFPDCLKEDNGTKATYNQLSYGKKLGITFPENVTLKQASYLISSAIDDPMTNFQKSLIEYYGLEMDPSRYASSEAASGLIASKLGETIKIQILLAGVIGTIDLKNIDQLREKAQEFMKDEKAMKSFRENFSYFNGIEPIIPGENINRNTTAYKKAKELIAA